MRKVFYSIVVIAMAGTIFTECKKENEQTNELFDVTLLKDVKYAYSEEVKIYDATGEYYVQFLVKSNDIDILNEQIEDFSNLMLDLLYEKQSMEEKDQENEILNNNSICNDIAKIDMEIELRKVFTGNAIGFKFVKKDKQKAVTFTHRSHFTMGLRIYAFTIEYVHIKNIYRPFNLVVLQINENYDFSTHEGTYTLLQNQGRNFGPQTSEYGIQFYFFPVTYDSKLTYNVICEATYYY